MSRRVIILAAIIIVVASCNREEEDFLWEYTAGAGTAWFLGATSDSGFISAGEVNGSPYLMRSGRKGNKVYSYSAGTAGVYRSALFDTAWCMAAGGAGGELLLTLVDTAGVKVWEKTIVSDVDVTEVFLFRGEAEGEIIALCGSGPDDPADLASGLFKVVFDTSGTILSEVTRQESGFFRISGAVMNPDGGFMIAVTKSAGTARPVATAIKTDISLATTMERELASNPSYGAASLDVCHTETGGYIVSGRTELFFEEELLMNSFVATIASSGTVEWKKYPENSNEGTAVIHEADRGLVYLLNRNCFIVNMLNRDLGSEYRRIQFFNACDPYDTGRRAESFIMTYNGNLLIAGSNAGKYYMALKPVSGV